MFKSDYASDILMNNYVDMSKIKDDIAPCGFCCYTCMAKRNGAVETRARELQIYFEGYHNFMKENLPFGKKHYANDIKAFETRLEKFAESKCGGCRSGAEEGCCIPNCFILECTKEKGVDFCGECELFPCDRSKSFFKGKTLSQFLLNNENIKKHGIGKYHTNAILNSHYEFYK